MRSILLALCLSLAAASASADTYTVTITTAQQDADTMARTGVLRHCGRNGGRREGIGLGSTPQQALENCCFNNGRYRIVEKAVAWSPLRRAWFAVIRYE